MKFLRKTKGCAHCFRQFTFTNWWCSACGKGLCDQCAHQRLVGLPCQTMEHTTHSHCKTCMCYEGVKERQRAIEVPPGVTQAIKVLNEALEADPEAIKQLLFHRVSTNVGMAEHPTIQVHGPPEGGYTLGILGLINGLLGAWPDTWGYVCVEVDDHDGHPVRFGITDGKAHGGE